MMNLHVTLGIDSFYKRDYDIALFNFSLALQEDANCKEAKLGAILTDMAKERESEAQALFEYYLLLSEDENNQSEDIVQDIIDLIDNSTESIYKLIESKELEFALNEENGIEYDDFIKLIEQRGSFKKTFEDIMFSTKVMISNKDDFIDFLEKLIENDFTEISLNYLESAITIFPNDTQLLSLAKKARKI